MFELITTGIQLGPEIYKLLQNIPFADIINPDIIGAIIAAASGDPALAAYLLDQGIREIKYELTQCFTAGTLVETDQGAVAIEEIEEGDYVLSLNFETGELEYSAVTETYVGETSELYLITAGDDVIEATYGHPFYVEEEGWVEAGELQVGDTLVMSSSGTVKVEYVEVVYLEEPVLVYNIEVEGTHNYFVGGGVLVHNGCGKTIKDIIDRIPAEYKAEGKCDQYAKEMAKLLIQEEIEFEIIKINSSAGVFSDKYGMIGDWGYHYGIKVGNTVYDNLDHERGVEVSKWLIDKGLDGSFSEKVLGVERFTDIDKIVPNKSPKWRQ